jgi:hypothetical protein
MEQRENTVLHMPASRVKREPTLPIKSVDEIIEEAGETVPWIVEDILARGALTDFYGPAKRGGKTTFWTHAIAAGARGDDIADFITTPARYLYLTEQGSNFALSLESSGLAKHGDCVSIVQYKDVSSFQWKNLITNAAADCEDLGFDALVVDTFAKFAKLKGSEENEAGPVLDRMRVLALQAQEHDIGIVMVRHAGKDGKARGSSAFEGEADIVVGISRPEGNHPPNIRKLEGIGRYGEWERIIELKDGRYISHGDDQKVQFNRAVKLIMSVITTSPETTKQNILDANTEGMSAATIDRALKWLTKQETIGAKQQMHLRGTPWVYWKAARQ